MAEKVKYQFNGQTYTIKGRLCHDIVKYYVEQNPNATLATLQKAFNTATHMIVATPEMALTVINSDGKAGGDYYMKEADQIAIKKGKVVVWSYWPESYFKPFMEQVKTLGLEVVVQEGEKKAVAKEPVSKVEQPNSPVMKILNEIKEKMESNGLERLGIYACDRFPEEDEMPEDEFEENYADDIDFESAFKVDYADVDKGYSWTNAFLRAIRLKDGEMLFDVQTLMGNNDEDPCEDLGYSVDETVSDLLRRDESLVMEAMDSVKCYIDTLIAVQKDINKKKGNHETNAKEGRCRNSRRYNAPIESKEVAAESPLDKAIAKIKKSMKDNGLSVFYLFSGDYYYALFEIFEDVKKAMPKEALEDFDSDDVVDFLSYSQLEFGVNYWCNDDGGYQAYTIRKIEFKNDELLFSVDEVDYYDGNNRMRLHANQTIDDLMRFTPNQTEDCNVEKALMNIADCYIDEPFLIAASKVADFDLLDYCN